MKLNCPFQCRFLCRFHPRLHSRGSHCHPNLSCKPTRILLKKGASILVSLYAWKSCHIDCHRHWMIRISFITTMRTFLANICDWNLRWHHFLCRWNWMHRCWYRCHRKHWKWDNWTSLLIQKKWIPKWKWNKLACIHRYCKCLLPIWINDEWKLYSIFHLTLQYRKLWGFRYGLSQNWADYFDY